MPSIAACPLLGSLALQPMLLEPLTYRFVVDLEHTQGQDDGQEHDTGIHGKMDPERGLDARYTFSFAMNSNACET